MTEKKFTPSPKSIQSNKTSIDQSKQFHKASFDHLTWDDMSEWAGSKIVSRGKNYQRSGFVHNLAETATGGLIAWVHGTRRYATLVEMKKERLVSSCSCPYGASCKHAVAVILEYLEHVKREEAVHQAKTDDLRFAELSAGDTGWENGEETDWEDANEADWN
ncbi:MAG: SWIM zinc finger family protein, partial [Candidatus Latescibacterota bacterium]